MVHISDRELIELINRAVSEEDRRRLEGQLASSEEDRQRRDALREVWVALGEWELPGRRRDLWPAIEMAVRRYEARLPVGAYGKRRGDVLRRIWRALDEWRTPEERRDLWPDIEAAARREGQPRRQKARWSLRTVLPAAAAVLMAAVVGHAVGRWARSVRQETAQPSADVERAAAEALYLDYLAAGSPGGLSDAILNVDASTGEEVSK